MYNNKIIKNAGMSEHGEKLTLYDNPKVSIGIPCYNRFQKLIRALKSVQNQTYKNLEIIVSDNASSDARIEKMMTKEAEKDKRIKYFRQSKNQECAFNFSFVLKQAAGDYFMWLCDDDWISSGYVEKCLETLISNNDVILASGVTDNITTMSICNRTPFLRVIRYFSCFDCTHTMIYGLFRKDEADRQSLFSCYGADWIWVADLLFKGKLKIVESVQINIDPEGISSSFLHGLKKLSFLCHFSILYATHIIKKSPPYNNLSLTFRLSFAIVAVLTIFFAKIKMFFLHAFKKLLPAKLIRLLNIISRRKKKFSIGKNQLNEIDK